MKDYNKLFVELVNELQQNQYVKIDSIDTDFKALQQTNLNFFDYMLNKNFGFVLPKKKHSTYNFFNYTRIYWFYEINEKLKGEGDFNLKNAYRCISRPNPHKIWNDSTPEKDLKILEQFRILIDSPDAGDNKLIGFKIDKKKYKEELWFYNRGKLYLMDLDYEGLLNAILDTKGIGNWEYFFCDFDTSDSLHRDIPNKLKQDLEALKILFPNTDYTFYENKLETLLSK